MFVIIQKNEKSIHKYQSIVIVTLLYCQKSACFWFIYTVRISRTENLGFQGNQVYKKTQIRCGCQVLM